MAWLPTLDELKQRTYARLRDSEKAFVLDSSVTQWLNEAMMDLNARLRVKRATDTGTSSSGGVVTFPDDMVEIVSLWFDTDQVQFVDDFTWNWYKRSSTPIGEQTLGRVINETVETYPVQVSQTYTLEYVQRPTEMDNGTDPADLTPELAERLPWYAIAEAKYQEGEVDEAERFMALYQEGLPGRPRGLYRLRPQTLNLTVEQNWYDTDA